MVALQRVENQSFGTRIKDGGQMRKKVRFFCPSCMLRHSRFIHVAGFSDDNGHVWGNGSNCMPVVDAVFDRRRGTIVELLVAVLGLGSDDM